MVCSRPMKASTEAAESGPLPPARHQSAEGRQGDGDAEPEREGRAVDRQPQPAERQRQLEGAGQQRQASQQPRGRGEEEVGAARKVENASAVWSAMAPSSHGRTPRRREVWTNLALAPPEAGASATGRQRDWFDATPPPGLSGLGDAPVQIDRGGRGERRAARRGGGHRQLRRRPPRPPGAAGAGRRAGGRARRGGRGAHLRAAPGPGAAAPAGPAAPHLAAAQARAAGRRRRRGGGGAALRPGLRGHPGRRLRGARPGPALGVRDVVVGWDFTAGHERARVEALRPLLAGARPSPCRWSSR